MTPEVSALLPGNNFVSQNHKSCRCKQEKKKNTHISLKERKKAKKTKATAFILTC